MNSSRKNQLLALSSILTLSSLLFVAGCKKSDDPGPAPTVSSTTPAASAVGIARNTVVTASFSAAMSPTTITATTFTLLNGTTAVSGTVSYTGTTATFTPASILDASTVYTATITTGAKASTGSALAANKAWTFTTVGLPVASSTDPLDNATAVALGKVVAITFNGAMDPLTITATTFMLKQGTTAVAGVVAYSGTTATFTSTNALAANLVYTATVTTGAKNAAGDAILANKVWSFTTVGLSEANATDPLDNAVGVAQNKVVSLTFSKAMNPLTITSSTFMLKQGTTAVAGAVAYSGTTATFTPTNALATNTVYTATVTTGAKDVAGDAIAANKVWSFTTVGLPEVSSTDPLNSAVDVIQNKVVAATFSKAMDATTITASTFTLKQGTTAVAGAVAYSGTTATFTSTNALAVNTVYTATITTGAKDAAGNAIAANKVWSFTTVGLPVVTATNPLNNATGVARNKIVSLTFNKAMDATTITSLTFMLSEGANSVSGVVAYSGTTATFTPAAILSASTAYTATVTTGAKDLAGNAILANKVWSFTTGGTSSTLAAVDLGAAGNYVILAKTAINNNPTSAITGDLGLSPAAESYITGFALTDATGFATASQVTGKVYAADQADPTGINLTTAVTNMLTAYTDAAGRPTPDFSELGTGNIGGLTLAPGLYNWTSTVTLPSAVTISGSSTDVWIFQTSGDLIMSNAVNITLTGGAQAKNIFWQVAGTVLIGTASHFEGIILSMTGITFQTGASFKGRALAQTAVILDGNAITQP